jgi:hypothetical protein
LQFTARKPPEADAGGQSGEGSEPFTLLTADWQLAVHAGLLNSFPRAGRWLKQKRVSGSWWRST